MKNSKKIMLMLSVVHTFASSNLMASRYNMFDNTINPEMVQIHNEYVTHSKKEKIMHSLLDTILEPRFNSNLAELYNQSSNQDMLSRLIKLQHDGLAIKRPVNDETVKLFDEARIKLKRLVDQQILHLYDAIMAYAVMPDASPAQLLEGGKVILKVKGSLEDAGSFCWASGKHPNATFAEVLSAATLINSFGPTHVINAVCLILEELIRRNQTLTQEESQSGIDMVMRLSTSGSYFISIVKLIMDDFPQFNILAEQIIKKGMRENSLNMDELEAALLLIQELTPNDQSTIHRLSKKVGSMSRAILAN